MTQAELAAKLGISYQRVSQIETGGNATLHTLVRVANALAVRLEDIVGGL